MAAHEEAVIAAQELRAGRRVMRRLRGIPGAFTIDIDARTVVSNIGFPTVGLRSLTVVAPAKKYYEVTLLSTPTYPQFGWADTDAFEAHSIESEQSICGVGDDAHSWGVDFHEGAPK